MQILQVSCQYYHIRKFLPGSGFQALNAFTKQELLINKEQPSSFQGAWLEPPTGVRAQPGPYLAREFDVMVPVKHKIQGSVSTKLLKNFQNSGPHSPLRDYQENTEQGSAFIS